MTNYDIMTFGNRVKRLRRDLQLSQEAIGAQGFVSTPGWIKVENGQRQASEKMIDKLVRWLVEQKYMGAAAAKKLREELLILKYLGSNSTFVRDMARAQGRTLFGAESAILLSEEPGQYTVKPKRGRPVGTPKRKA